MTSARVEVVTIERRRRWSRSDKERLVSASLEPAGIGVRDRPFGGAPHQLAVPMAQATLRSNASATDALSFAAPCRGRPGRAAAQLGDVGSAGAKAWSVGMIEIGLCGGSVGCGSIVMLMSSAARQAG